VAKAATAVALKVIDDIDQTLPREQQTDLAAAAWSEAIAEALLEAGISAASLTEAEVEKLLEKKLKANKEAEQEEKKKQTKEEAEASMWSDVYKLAEGFGLDMAKGSADYRLFHSFAEDLAQQEFMKGETPPPLKDQVEWVYKEVIKVKGGVAQTSEEEKEKQRKIQERNSILTRGLTRNENKEEPLTEPVRIVDIRKQITESAREKQRAAR